LIFARRGAILAMPPGGGLYSDKDMFGNWLKTSILMAAIVALFGVLGAALGGGPGMLIALLIAAAINLWAYWYSDRAVLSMYNAREVDSSSAPGL
jgi:heat shock protein HtpX